MSDATILAAPRERAPTVAGRRTDDDDEEEE